MWQRLGRRAALGLALLGSVALVGCAEAPVAVPVAPGLWHDELFAASPAQAEAADPARVFALSPAMEHYLDQQVLGRAGPREPEQRLLQALYQREQLQLRYDTELTRNAAQAFEARAGNCMSLVIMTAAFAKRMGLAVRYQSVQVDPGYDRTGDLYFSIGHVNLSIGRPLVHELNVVQPMRRWMTIDFLPRQDLRYQRFDVIEEATLVAMYMNNKAAEALARGAVDDAYWWVRAALREDRQLLIAYNTLGVVYLRRGRLDEAENTLRFALALEPRGAAVLSNLAQLMADRGRADEARALFARLAEVQPDPPFKFFRLGQQAMQAGDYAQARDWFERELRRDPDHHEFHFWLALAYLKLGELPEARRELALAEGLSRTREQQAQYAAKLQRLRAAADATKAAAHGS